LPAGGDRTFGHLPHPSCRCRLSGEAGHAMFSPTGLSPTTATISRSLRLTPRTCHPQSGRTRTTTPHNTAPATPAGDLSARRPKNPSSILAHQLRRRFPPRRSEDPVPCSVQLPKELRPPIPLRLARRLPRPRCSTALLGLGPFHVALSPWGGNRPRKRKHQLFRRLLPTGPELGSLRHRPCGQFGFELHSIACRRRSVLLSPAAPYLPLPALWRGWDLCQ
jgi:hypothetical protein